MEHRYHPDNWQFQQILRPERNMRGSSEAAEEEDRRFCESHAGLEVAGDMGKKKNIDKNRLNADVTAARNLKKGRRSRKRLSFFITID
jgi:hypothetical protein